MLLLAEGIEWYNYPGLELWKFANLAIFLAAGIYVLRKPINRALLARRGTIERELVTAQEEREKAVARVAEADSLLSRLDDDVRTVQQQANEEAAAEKQRIAESTEREIEKLKQQAQREMQSADKLARKQLRQFLAEKSVQMARESIRTQMRPEDDTALIREGIGELRRTTV
ncbi:MAG TPA: ATP synthase F0 subunit B [Pyrinomonadaceae bacterium]|nr:ATP synthase F0 subunit B [Pyrinomonadaceae bacterium]